MFFATSFDMRRVSGKSIIDVSSMVISIAIMWEKDIVEIFDIARADPVLVFWNR